MLLFVLLSLAQIDDPKVYTPNDCILFALHDLQSLDPSLHHHCRYLSLAHMPAKQRPAYIQTLDFVLNSLSRRQSMIYCTPVFGSNHTVVRVMLNEYRQTGDGWESLASRGSGPQRVAAKTDAPDPYYTVNLGEITQQVQRKDKNGTLLYWDGDKSKPVYDEVKGLAAGTWFDITAYRTIQTSTKSNHPILRADWFIANASLNPAYSEMLGVKTLAEFNKLVRYRTEDDDLSGRAVVADSQLVSLHQRGIEFTPKVNGTYWQTYDYFKSSGINNLLKNPLKKTRDAGEVFAELPNGLQAFTLVNEQDKIIDVADGNLVADQITPWKNKLVWNGLYSCTTCHRNGAQDITDEVRPLTAPPRALVSRNQKDFLEFVDKYSKDLNSELQNTRLRYAAAVQLATRGLKPEQNTDAYGAAFINYMQKPLNMEQAARETGCTTVQLTDTLQRILQPDPAVATLLAGRPLRRDLWEAAYSQIATAVYQRNYK